MSSEQQDLIEGILNVVGFRLVGKSKEQSSAYFYAIPHKGDPREPQGLDELETILHILTDCNVQVSETFCRDFWQDPPGQWVKRMEGFRISH